MATTIEFIENLPEYYKFLCRRLFLCHTRLGKLNICPKSALSWIFSFGILIDGPSNNYLSLVQICGTLGSYVKATIFITRRFGKIARYNFLLKKRSCSPTMHRNSEIRIFYGIDSVNSASLLVLNRINS